MWHGIDLSWHSVDISTMTPREEKSCLWWRNKQTEDNRKQPAGTHAPSEHAGKVDPVGSGRFHSISAHMCFHLQNILVHK